MSFRLTNMSATFQKLINHVLYNHLNKFVIAYLNNILIFFKTEKKHEKHIKKILKKFQNKNLYLKLKKYKFHKQQVKYLEHIVTIKECITLILSMSSMMHVKHVEHDTLRMYLEIYKHVLYSAEKNLFTFLLLCFF